MTDKDVVERFHAIVGVGYTRPSPRSRYYKPHHKDQWRWHVSAFDDVLFVLGLFKPWLGERRAARAAELVDAYTRDLAERGAERRCRSCGTVFRPKIASRRAVYCSPACYRWSMARREQRVRVSPDQMDLA